MLGNKAIAYYIIEANDQRSFLLPRRRDLSSIPDVLTPRRF